ncbi:hypothetical protein [Gordonia soli]|uniref:Uncharacterized protein n=1 Tax=Gordonia soli NBRC 108243 TaxID=1223545 RepID=M0QLZ5_9ACTN|nr:hypothetical protein [Gordonia soli]GAC68402.1 hypothetical protein GS4_15_00530 [Gordonia soli NBRC 108243]
MTTTHAQTTSHPGSTDTFASPRTDLRVARERQPDAESVSAELGDSAVASPSADLRQGGPDGPRGSVDTRFLTPQSPRWTNDGTADWLPGRVAGLTYTEVPGTARLVLHNGGPVDVGVLSTPRLPRTDGTELTVIAAGASESLPAAGYHILQREMVDGHPVLVGQIWQDEDGPVMTVDGPVSGEIDIAAIDSANRFWTPGDADFGGPEMPDLEFRDPFAAGLYVTADGGEVAVHNRGDQQIAVLTIGSDGPRDLLLIAPEDTAPLPAGDLVAYVQGERLDGVPVLYGVLWIAGGRMMPSVLPLPGRREFLDYRYLTPWSSDWDCGYPDQLHLDAELDEVTYQYRAGAESITVRNDGHMWIAVLHNSGDDRRITEVAPGGRASFPVSPDADRGQVFSMVGERVDSTPGRTARIDADGEVAPGSPGRPGTPTNYGSVVIMLGAVVYSAIPKKNLYLAWSDRRRRWARR